MSMNIQGNTYTFIYSSIIVVIVATLLTIASVALQPRQERNVEIEKKQNVLASVWVDASVKDAEKLYKEYVKDVYAINSRGEKLGNVDAFHINMREEQKKPRSERALAVYEVLKNDTAYIVLPLYGKGLWGPIWGYMSFRKEVNVKTGMPNYNTVYGAVFDHKGETPGLGAEINQPFFEHPFKGKKVFNELGKFVSIEVVKGGGSGSDPHKVDAISGGTITSKGLQAMVDTSVVVYTNFFIQSK
jgi:Na+-transporting NADH:ubiquinone oxidoreductase subunit C